MTDAWAAAQYCDDWSSANPGATDTPAWVDTGRKYLRLCRWAQRRYTVDGTLATHIAGKPTTYTRIEYAAWRRYMK